MAEIAWTALVEADLGDIHRFIARNSPQFADIAVDRVHDAVSRLRFFAESGLWVAEAPGTRYREVLVGAYQFPTITGARATW